MTKYYFSDGSSMPMEWMDGWKMALEALLRCGGNVVIPGTDEMSRINQSLVKEFGLYVTHHHAEPLGAQMFVRAYPELEPNYFKYPELFEGLWEEAIKEQKDQKVIWNVCFRGQGDQPFWSYDTEGEFDTSEKRGNMISRMIQKQVELVKKHVKNPVFCTNLYGEIMELYDEGHIILEDDIIRVYADNGYGKMVTRRRDNHSVRVSAMPRKEETNPQGIYYHVSFYDLQAANHITMLQNSAEFVANELSHVLANGGTDLWIINCSNIRPHVYYLDAVRKLWFGEQLTNEGQSKTFVDNYFKENDNIKQQIATCYRDYSDAMISYGTEEDEKVGEQFYTENIRILAHQFVIGKTSGAKELQWLTGQCSLSEQVEKLSERCTNGVEKLKKLMELCQRVENVPLFDQTIGLHIAIHLLCAKGVIWFGDAFRAYEKQQYKTAFILFGECAQLFQQANEKLRQSEQGVWDGFYANDCFADIKHTAYMARKMMGIMRELGDNVRHDLWYRETCYKKEDQQVYLLLVTENHKTDWELYEAMKEKRRREDGFDERRNETVRTTIH